MLTKAEQLLAKLGYPIYENTPAYTHYAEDDANCPFITFFNDGIIHIGGSITVDILDAIKLRTDELGWKKENK